MAKKMAKKWRRKWRTQSLFIGVLKGIPLYSIALYWGFKGDTPL
jgi:hypothetical protein